MSTLGRILSFARPEKAPAPDMREKSLTTEHASVGGLSTLYDEDGITIATYKEMLEREPQLKAAIYLKMYARLSTGWAIEPASQDALDVEIAEFVLDQLEQFAGTADGVLRRAMLAMAYKISVQEIVYRHIESGRWAGKYGWAAIKPKNGETFTVKTDVYGNVINLEQRMGMGHVSPFDPSYFLLWCWEHDGDFKGKSDLRAAYRWYKAKDMIARFWNVFLERYAMPLPVAKHPQGAQKTAIDALVKVLANLTTHKAVAVPREWEVEFIEATRQGGDYLGAIAYCDRMMARSVLVPQLLLDEGQSGSYSLGKSHGESFKWILGSLGKEIEEDIMGDQLIRRLVDWNYSVENYPRFKFKPFTDDAFAELASAFGALVDKGIVDKDEPVVRERLTLPQRHANGAGSEEAGGGPEQAPAGGNAAPSATPPASARATVRPSAAPAAPASAPASSSGGKTTPAAFEMAPAAGALKHAAKMDFAEAASRLDEIEAETQRNAARAIQAMHLDLKRAVRKAKIVETRDIAAIDKLRIGHVGELRAALERGLGLALAHGAEDGFNAVTAGLAAAGVPADIEPRDRTPLNFDQGALNHNLRDIYDAWRGKVPIQKDLLAHYSRSSFTIAGNVSDSLLEQAKSAIGRGMIRGNNYASIESALNEIFEPYYLTEIDPEVGTSHRLHNIVRTNMSEAYNTGQMNLYRDPEVGDYVRAFEYSSVMDGRTSDYCQAWHGVVLKKDDTRWVAALPPNHFQCRAVLIPIVQGEAFTETANPPGILPQIGFRT